MLFWRVIIKSYKSMIVVRRNSYKHSGASMHQLIEIKKNEN